MLIHKIVSKAGVAEFKRITSQDRCEIGYDFMGFLGTYEILRKNVSKKNIIIDLGCYLAPQAYLFDEYKGYIGIDVIGNLDRFKPINAKHYVCTIEEFIEKNLVDYDLENCFAICSFVPDKEQVCLAQCAFKNIFVYYVNETPYIKINGKEIAPHGIWQWNEEENVE